MGAVAGALRRNRSRCAPPSNDSPARSWIRPPDRPKRPRSAEPQAAGSGALHISAAPATGVDVVRAHAALEARASRSAPYGRAGLVGRLPHGAAGCGRRSRRGRALACSSAPRLEKLDAMRSLGAWPSPRTGQGLFRPACATSNSHSRSNLALDGPLGMGGVRVVLDGEDLSIATSRGDKSRRRGARAPSSSERLGFALPLAELRWWLLGIPAPGEASVDQDGGQRRDPRLRAAGLARSASMRVRRRWDFRCRSGSRPSARVRAHQAAGRTLAAVSGNHRWSAPAKLNLMLHVVGRRADGYHELQTVFQLIDLCDRIEIAVRDDGAIIRRQGSGGSCRKPRIWRSGRPRRSKESRHRLGRRNLH